MKKSSLFILISVLVLAVCFAGNKQKPSTIFAHVEDNIVLPNPQPIPAQEWRSVVFAHADGFGPQFSWRPFFASEVFLERGTSYHAIGSVTVKVDQGQCAARLVYGDGKGNLTELAARTFPTDVSIVVITVAQDGYLTNDILGAYLNLQVMCDYPADISYGSLYVINQ